MVFNEKPERIMLGTTVAGRYRVTHVVLQFSIKIYIYNTRMYVHNRKNVIVIKTEESTGRGRMNEFGVGPP